MWSIPDSARQLGGVVNPRVDNSPLAKKREELNAAEAAAAFGVTGLQAAAKVKAARATLVPALEDWWKAVNAARRADLVAKRPKTLGELEAEFEGDPRALLAALLSRKSHREATQTARRGERVAERKRGCGAHGFAREAFLRGGEAVGC